MEFDFDIVALKIYYGIILGSRNKQQNCVGIGRFKGRFPLGVFLLADEKTKEKKLAERKKS